MLRVFLATVFVGGGLLFLAFAASHQNWWTAIKFTLIFSILFTLMIWASTALDREMTDKYPNG